MLIFSCASFFRGSLPVDHLFVWCTDRPAGEGLQALRGRASCAQVSPCLADPQKLRGVQLEARSAARRRSPPGFWAALQTRPRSCDTAAGSWEASRRPSSPPWRPDTPLEAAPDEGGSSALLAASQRTQTLPPAPRASRVCRSSAGRTPTQPGASWPESPRSRPTRLRRTEGKSPSTHSRPRPGGQTERAPLSLRATRRLGSAAQY